MACCGGPPKMQDQAATFDDEEERRKKAEEDEKRRKDEEERLRKLQDEEDALRKRLLEEQDKLAAEKAARLKLEEDRLAEQKKRLDEQEAERKRREQEARDREEAELRKPPMQKMPAEEVAELFWTYVDHAREFQVMVVGLVGIELMCYMSFVTMNECYQAAIGWFRIDCLVSLLGVLAYTYFAKFCLEPLLMALENEPFIYGRLIQTWAGKGDDGTPNGKKSSLKRGIDIVSDMSGYQMTGLFWFQWVVALGIFSAISFVWVPVWTVVGVMEDLAFLFEGTCDPMLDALAFLFIVGRPCWMLLQMIQLLRWWSHGGYVEEFCEDRSESLLRNKDTGRFTTHKPKGYKMASPGLGPQSAQRTGWVADEVNRLNRTGP